MTFDDEDQWVHSTWRGKVKVDDSNGLKFANFGLVMSWIVKLEFEKDGSPMKGSGFFVDIPNAQYDVIFTVAHNLVSKTGTPAKDIKAYNTKYFGEMGYSVPPGPEHVIWCKEYEVNPVPEADYGFIRIPKSKSNLNPKPRGFGFGFSIKLAYEDYFRGDVHVTGFQDTSVEQPVTSTGRSGTCSKKVVMYYAFTEPGISGSAVWIAYKSLPVIIAIHNNAPAEGKKGASRGARLTPTVFRMLFNWLDSDLILRNIQIHAVDVRPKKDDPKLPDAGLFLSFEGTLDFARVRLRTGTKFDLLLAEVMPGKANDQYALAVADKGDWVKFVDPLVMKTGKLEDECLFQRKSFETKPPSWQIVVNTKFLTMGGEWLKQYDEDAESSELSFATSKDRKLFNRFWYKQ